MERNRTLQWRISANKAWALDRPRVLGILNLTPDSFSDGGQHVSVDAAVRFGVEAIDSGADGVDIGGESTRPGAARVDAGEQIRRVIPAISALRRRFGDQPVITIDTTCAPVAAAALDAGADAINDVSAGTEEDEAMLSLAASRGCGIVLMHRLTTPDRDVFSHQYERAPSYGAGGVIAAVEAYLRDRALAAEAAGISQESIVIDPGFGFGKTVEQNLELLRETSRLAGLGYPVMSGLSRKSFVARASGIAMDRPPSERAYASVGLSVLHLIHGAAIFRIHDVGIHIEALTAAHAAMFGIQ